MSNRITPGPIEVIKGAGTAQLYSGTADPSAGAGVVANEGSLYMRSAAGAGEVWYKAGAADTAWIQFNTAAAPSYTYATLTPAEVATITEEASPTLMWRYNEATGATELVGGTANLAAIGTPTMETADGALGGNGVDITADGTDALAAASAAVGAVGADVSFTLIHICRFTGFPASSSRAIAGNRTNTAGFFGYELALRAAGVVRWQCVSATGSPFRDVSGHDLVSAQVLLGNRNVTAGTVGLHTAMGSSDNAGSFNAGDLASDKPFSVGDNALWTAAGQIGGMSLLWIGPTGEFADPAAARLALAVALSYEAAP